MKHWTAVRRLTTTSALSAVVGLLLIVGLTGTGLGEGEAEVEITIDALKAKSVALSSAGGDADEVDAKRCEAPGDVIGSNCKTGVTNGVLSLAKLGSNCGVPWTKGEGSLCLSLESDTELRDTGCIQNASTDRWQCEVKLTIRRLEKKQVKIDAGSKTVGGISLAGHLGWPVDEGWRFAEIEQQGVVKGVPDDEFKNGIGVALSNGFLFFVGSGEQYALTKKSGGPAATGGGSGQPTKCDHTEEELQNSCKAPTSRRRQLVCVHAVDRSNIRFLARPDNNVLMPNTDLLVRAVVLDDEDVEVDVTLGGQKGLYEPEILRADRTQSKRDGACPKLDEWTFGPRRPGSAELKVAVTEGESTEEETITLHVPKRYIGAVRLGFGLVFGNAVDRTYEARTVSGSSQAEIVASGSGNTNVELVIGFAAFPDYWWWGGRSYDRNDHWWVHLLRHIIPSPYIGLGVLGSSESGVDAMTSLYLGLEWELIRSFAVSFNVIYRRVTRLRAGYRVGQAVADGESFTEDRGEWGLGLVINVSPEFLRVSRIITEQQDSQQEDQEEEEQ